MQNPDFSPIGGGVNDLIDKLNSAHFDARYASIAFIQILNELTDKHIVIACDIDNPRAFARFAQEFLNHIVVGLWPVPTFFQLPAVDNVADQINRLCLVVRHKVQQSARLAIARTQMHIRNPQCAVLLGLFV